GWLALHGGDRIEALRYADEAAAVTALRNDATGQAEEAELRALAGHDPVEQQRLLRDAQARYARIGKRLFVARTLVLQARLAGDRAAAASAESRLRALGVRPEAALAAGPLHEVGAFGTVVPGGVTLDGFRATVRAGLDRFARGETGAGRRLLADAVDGYPVTGAPPSGYLDAMRALAGAAAAEGSPHAALRWYLRVLEHEPYDEDGHLGTVRALAEAGRHGEARLRYRVYADRMREIGHEPAPYPGEPVPVPGPRSVPRP